MNQKTLVDFLIDLAYDWKSLQHFERDRQQFVRNSGLSPGDQQVLLQDDPDMLQQAIASATGVAIHAAPAGTVKSRPASTTTGAGS